MPRGPLNPNIVSLHYVLAVTDPDLGHVPVSRAGLLPIYSKIANKV
jgi:hypothetical protein